MTGAMTREEFEVWIRRTGRALTDPNAPIVPCRCGDVNCKGWRFDIRPPVADEKELRS